ncbi:hypothetical protein CHCC14819_0951 [Bacillus licheniformis]|nr:hypothetical protein CHCC14819_0951 [Bacillus licheniformis]
MTGRRQIAASNIVMVLKGDLSDLKCFSITSVKRYQQLIRFLRFIA